MNPSHADGSWKIARRHFLGAAGAATAGLVFQARGASAPAMPAGGKGMATIRGAFLYPSTQSLREAGYYSWPGSNFDAEGHHKDYLAQIDAMGAGVNGESGPAPAGKFKKRIIYLISGGYAHRTAYFF